MRLTCDNLRRLARGERGSVLIAQQFRGPVGTPAGSSVSSGYAKAYTYDDDLRYREPPYFIDPAISPWQIIRQNEQVPPR